MSTLEALRALPLFEGVGEAALSQWSGSMRSISLEAGGVLLRQGDPGEALYLVVRGRLRTTVQGRAGEELEISRLGPGDSVGEIQRVAGGLRSATVTAVEPCELLELHAQDLDRLGPQAPRVMERLQATARRRLHRSLLVGVLRDWVGPLEATIVDELERIIDWVSLVAGVTLFRQGEPADSWYIVANGRLEASIDGVAIGEVARGESVGEMALITGRPRSATLRALRDSTLMRFPVAAFEQILGRFPGVGLAITRVLVQRITHGAVKRPPEGLSLAWVPLGPLSSAPLSTALSRLGTVVEVTAEALISQGVMDPAAASDASHPSWLRLSSWLEEQRARRNFVLMLAEPGPFTPSGVEGRATPWTKWAVRQADQVLLAADATADPALTALEEDLFPHEEPPGARRTLVLLHPRGDVLPTGTALWLAARKVDGHLHVALDRPADLQRLARIVSGRGVGVALSGGGARGFAHIGAIRALHEAGVPIDFLAGTSAGAAMAAQAAMGLGYDAMVKLNEAIFAHKPFRELTVPYFSLLATERVVRGLKEAYGEIQVEDLWIPMVAISANLTRSTLRVHDRGPLWLAVRASTSLPGVAVPVVEDGEVLVDGGLLNNLPVDVVRSLGATRVIAIDVMGVDAELQGTEFPSPWAALARRVLPFVKADTSPNIVDILTRSMLLASLGHARAAKESATLVLKPPVGHFNLLDVEAISEIARLGYEDTKARLAAEPFPAG